MALSLVRSYDINVPQIEKIYNNLYIAQFLEYEQETLSLKQCQLYAKNTIRCLKKLLSGESNGKEHVILTNLASLSLYVGQENDYFNAKSLLENSFGCKDVSDLNDIKINDFYRYHFAWYEFYRNLTHSAWEKCENILNNLDGFYPALFKRHIEIDRRIIAAKNILEKRECPDPLNFCLNFMKDLSYTTEMTYSRGLPLSDLQFTSWD